MTQREKVRFTTNVPFIVLLEQVEGREATSSYNGREYRYNVVQHRRPHILYLPPEGANALRRAAPNVGDEVELLKAIRDGQPEWSARVLSDAQEPLPSQEQAREVQAPAPHYSGQPERPSAPHSSAPAKPQTDGSARSGPRSTAQLATRCMFVAFDVMMATEQYAASKGVTLEFNEEDIRALALSIYIGKTREGR